MIRLKRLLFIICQLCFTFNVIAQDWSLDTTLEEPSGTISDASFGRSVAISGNVAIVGSPDESVGGIVYIYEKANGSWSQINQLQLPTPASTDLFGYSVDIEGDVVAVGAPGYITTFETGAVFVFERPATGWSGAISFAQINSPMPSGGGEFGFSIDLRGDDLLVGAPVEGITGRAHLFSKASNASWSAASLAATLQHSVLSNDRLGYTVALGDDFAVLGCPRCGNEQGNGFIYEKGAGWSSKTTADAVIRNVNRQVNDNFGWEIEADGDRIAVWAKKYSQVYIFNRPTTGWGADFTANGAILPSYLVLPGISDAYQFGSSISLDGDRIAVGSPSYEGSGRVYIYELGTSAATLVQELAAPETLSAAFGVSVTIDGNSLIAGDSYINSGIGKSYLYEYRYEVDKAQTICFNDTYTFGAQTLSTNGIYMESFVAQNGLDSLVTLDFSVAVSQLVGSIVSYQDPKCFGSSDGSATFTASGGTPPYEFSFDGGAFGSNNEFTGLADGSYSVVIRDAIGCTVTKNVFLFEPGTPLNVSATGTDLACYLGKDGIITVAASGGTPNYSYSVDGVNYQSAATITNLDAGTYTVYAKDANGCVATIAGITLSQPPAITIVGSSTNVSCYGGSNGEINITAVSGGNGGPFEFSKDGVNYQSSGLFTGLSVGVTTIYIKDGAGCVFQEDWTILQPNEIVVSPVASSTTTCGGSDGALEANLSGGVGPFQFSLDGVNFQASNVFNGLAAGDYTVYIKDANDCQVSTVVKVNDPDLFTLATTVINSTCAGSNNGSVNISPDPTGSNYQFSLDGTNFQTSSKFENLAPGSYTATVTDDKQCENSIQFLIAEPAQLEATVATVDISCKDGANGTITITASGGTAPYSYSLDGTSFQSEEVFSSLGAASYTITLKDAQACTATYEVAISEPEELILNATATVVRCAGAADGKIVLEATGGTAPYQYRTDGDAFVDASEFTGLEAGAYSLTVKDANGCTATSEAVVTQPDVLTVEAGSISPTCTNGPDGSIDITAAGGTAPYSYSIDGADFQESNSFSGLAAGYYTVAVKDANGCTVNTEAIITEPMALIATVVSTSSTCAGLTNGSIDITTTGGTAPYSYSINGADFQESSSFSGLAAGDYTVAVKDANGCVVEVAVAITAPDGFSVQATTADVTCSGLTDGSVSLQVTGPENASYTYSIDGESFQEAATFDGLAAGDYTFTVKNASGCTVEMTAVISSPSVLSLSLSEIGGAVAATAEGGTSPYTYSSNGTDFQESNLFDLTPGDYTIIVKDANGCEATSQVTIELETGVGDDLFDQGIIAYPNPASHAITFNATTITAVRLFDLSGNRVLTVNNYRTRESIDLSHLVPGVVIVELELTTGERIKQRLIIER
jgi:hypothetical protein